MLSILYILLGAIGLGFLVFIHELGHYVVARRVGMKVEVFSIGFGKPFYTFWFQGVKWQVCYLLFGGFVKIAGMEKEGTLEPHEIKNGFFGRTPLDRIKVALAGPLVNIIFAFVAFSIIFFLGGREKPFSEYTKIIGYVDASSEAYQKGMRPGDQLTAIDGHEFKGFHDLLYSSVLNQERINISGIHEYDYQKDQVPFQLNLSFYPHPYATNTGVRTFGVLAPAMFLVYEPMSDGRNNPIPKKSSMFDSGIQYGDRIIWADGDIVFSVSQLQSIVNRKTSLLTVKRDHNTFFIRVPRLHVSDLRISHDQLAELDDWQHELGIKGDIKNLVFIPYNIDAHCHIEHAVTFIDDESKQNHVSSSLLSPLDQVLVKGDRIIAVDGKEVVSAFQLLREIQEKKVQIIVDRSNNYPKQISSKNQDEIFVKSINWSQLKELINVMASHQKTTHVGTLYRLNPVTPIAQKIFPRSDTKQDLIDSQTENYLKKVDEIKDPKEKEKALHALENYQNRLFLGIALQDKQVNYNPAPWQLFAQVCQDMFKTIGALFSGSLNPKWMSGPVGVIHVMHHGWSLGIKEALYWLGMISLGLGFSNLLPIPVLDGGYICFSIWEIITGRPIKAKIMERMIIPFVVLLILFFIFVTYHDLMRLFYRIF
ncbi:MAG: site-2 protease family protein [Chlamydiales bacterium]|nr:site-2 protease family protein [Chlamydiales bacterium]